MTENLRLENARLDYQGVKRKNRLLWAVSNRSKINKQC